MSWIVTLLVLALIAWFVFRWLRGRAGTPVAGADPLDHDRDGLNRPLPGQRAGTEGEVHDAARSHVGGHLEDGATGVGTDARRADPATGDAVAGNAVGGDTAAADTAARRAEPATGHSVTGDAATGGAAGGTPADGAPHRVETSVRTQPPASDASPSITTSPGDDSATVTVPGSFDPAPAKNPASTGTRGDGGTGTDGTLSADAAAEAARASANTGGTGTAVLAGIATAAGAAVAATGVQASDDGDHGKSRDPDDDADRVNPPDPGTAGAFDADGRGPGHASNLPDGGVGAAGSDPDAATADEARTNAPVGDAAPGAAARKPSPAPGTETAPATSPDEPASPDERTNAPKTRTDDPSAAPVPGAGHAGTGIDASGYRDRSNLVAGTVTLAVGGATAAAGGAVLEDGATPGAQAARLHADAVDGATEGATRRAAADALGDTDDRTAVREMMKILNLRDADATRLGISKDDFARLWQGDDAASTTLVDEVGGRLRRMLG